MNNLTKTVYGFKAFDAKSPEHLMYQMNDFFGVAKDEMKEFVVLNSTITPYPSSSDYDFAGFVTFSYEMRIELPKKSKRKA